VKCALSRLPIFLSPPTAWRGRCPGGDAIARFRRAAGIAEIAADLGRAESVGEEPSDFRLNKRNVPANCLGDDPHPFQNYLKKASGVIKAIRHGWKGELRC